MTARDEFPPEVVEAVARACADAMRTYWKDERARAIASLRTLRGLGVLAGPGEVVVILPTGKPPEFLVGQTWVPANGKGARTIMWIGRPSFSGWSVNCVGFAADPAQTRFDTQKDGVRWRHDSYLPIQSWRKWVKTRRAMLAAAPRAGTEGGQ